jgi:hypothetical protein
MGRRPPVEPPFQPEPVGTAMLCPWDPPFGERIKLSSACSPGRPPRGSIVTVDDSEERSTMTTCFYPGEAEAGAGALLRSPAMGTWSDPVVVRRINTTPAELAHRVVSVGGPPARLALGRLGELRVDSHPRHDPSDSAPVWQMRSRLVGAGPRIALFSRVDIEISPASSRSVELRVLPRSRHIHRWAARRRRRYFQLAHAAADRLAQLFAG